MTIWLLALALNAAGCRARQQATEAWSPLLAKYMHTGPVVTDPHTGDRFIPDYRTQPPGRIVLTAIPLDVATSRAQVLRYEYPELTAILREARISVTNELVALDIRNLTVFVHGNFFGMSDYPPHRTAWSENHTPSIPCFPSGRLSSVSSPVRVSSAPMSFPRSDASRPVQPFLTSSLPVFVFIRASFIPPARCSVIRPLLTSRGISSSGSPQVRTRCFPARPPHFPPEADPPSAEPPRLNPRFRCVVPVRRIVGGLYMRFLFVSPPVSTSLPPVGWLPFQRWLQVVVLSHFHVRFLLQGTCTPFTTRPCWAHTTL